MTRLDHSELLYNKILLKYKRDRESFWDRHQKGAERAPPDGLQANGIRLLVVVVFCSVVSDSVTTWTAARQAPLSMGFSRQEYWSGLPFPSPEDLSDPGI